MAAIVTAITARTAVNASPIRTSCPTDNPPAKDSGQGDDEGVDWPMTTARCATNASTAASRKPAATEAIVKRATIHFRV